MPAAMIVPDKKVLDQTTFLPANDVECAGEFATVIHGYSVGEIAPAVSRTKDAAKKWKAGDAMPGGLSLMRMARTMPGVRNWMLAKMGPSFQQDHPQSISTAVLAIQTLAAKPGPEGDAVREALRLMTGMGES
jgi:hypothetical protein